jgi:hypothetical protein
MEPVTESLRADDERWGDAEGAFCEVCGHSDVILFCFECHGNYCALGCAKQHIDDGVCFDS